LHIYFYYLPLTRFLLAIQTIIRELGLAELKEIKKYLDSTQEAMFSASYEILIESKAILEDELKIPKDKSSWPKIHTTVGAHFLKELNSFKILPGDEQPIYSEEDENEGMDTEDLTGPTFRMHKKRTLLGFSLASIVLLALNAFGLISGFSGLWIAVGFLVLASWLGSKISHFVCSSTECRVKISPSDLVCPDCKRQIAGTIKNEEDRLEAEDKYEMVIERNRVKTANK
jgi:hypothetical protein